MKLAVFSPFNPQRSGISDYTEELLPHLAEHADIELFVDGFTPSTPEIAARFRWFDYAADPAALRRLGEYDAVVYHMGNDHRYHTRIREVALSHPGVVVFHDFALQDFFLGLARQCGDVRVYLDEMEACHGARARAEAEETFARGGTPPHVVTPTLFPLNARIARAAEAVIVHSEWSRERLRKIVPGTPVARVPMPAKPHALRHEATDADGAKGRPVSIASFGLITPGKGIAHALRALAALRQDYDLRYTLVGETNPYFDVRALIREYGMTDRVEITGHVSLEEFERRIATTDVALNMRERTVGETSASLCRIMAAGVASVVSNVGWFAELPDDSVVKIDMDECADALLLAYLKRLLTDAPLRARIGANARRYALAEHAIERSAAKYVEFIRDVVGQRVRRRFVGGVASELSRLGVGADDEEFLRVVAAEVAVLAPSNGHEKDAPESPAFRRSLEAAGAEITEKIEETTAAEVVPVVSKEAAGRLRKIEGIDYKRAAVEYPDKLDAERRHYLLTKPFYNLANKPPKHKGDGMDEETHRHFCDFANMAVALALPAGRRILDVGCGSGWLCEYFARLGYDVTGIDISPALIEAAYDRLRRVGYDVDHETPLRYRFLTHDAESAPLDEQFDAVICYDSLHHFEDERAVVRNLAAMLPVGGQLFVLEGDKPPEGSPTEAELVEVMQQYETLESPFSPAYLRALLMESGFAVVGDYVSVNGLFEREALEDDRLRVEPSAVNYLLCKKVTDGTIPASVVPDSRQPGRLRARLSPRGEWPGRVEKGARAEVALEVENMGDTLWLAGRAARRGVVMVGVRIFDAAGRLVEEFHGQPPLPRAIAPGESSTLELELPALPESGAYRLVVDMVDQQICWFEEHGSKPLEWRFLVN